MIYNFFFFFFQAEDGIRDGTVTGVQTCALPICGPAGGPASSDGGDDGPHLVRGRTGAHHGARGERQPRPARRAFPVARRFGPPASLGFLVDATPDRAPDIPPPRARPAAGIDDVPRRLDRPARLAGRPHRRGPRLPPECDYVLRERGRKSVV